MFEHFRLENSTKFPERPESAARRPIIVEWERRKAFGGPLSFDYKSKLKSKLTQHGQIYQRVYLSKYLHRIEPQSLCAPESTSRQRSRNRDLQRGSVED
ncbi:hypothetical protein EVAR_13616_1 [Eumeta japonica]|uniref:Uncharacterized protein n=1 Tax=Eumeta variegata TaxID=151549 RepID=A0A4C1UT94_EUMVA|nr:hypothetical protein EVAR_13616_1 [Eumeta japonica]